MSDELSVAAWLPFVGIPLALGAGLLRACGVRWRDDRLAFLAWTWPFGAFGLAVVMLGCLLGGLHPAHWPVAATVAAAIAALLARRRIVADGPNAAAAPCGTRPAAWWFWCVVIAGCVLLAGAAIATASEPCLLGDEGSLWAMKAKAFAWDWFHGDFVHAQNLSTHADYPPLNPLLQAWAHALSGGLTLFENRVPIQLCTLSCWLALAAALRRHAPAWLAALLLVVLLADPAQAGALPADADTLVALGLLMATDAWLRADAEGDRGHRAILAMGLAFALWSKNEATLYFALALAAGGAGALLSRRARTRASARPHTPPWWLVLPMAVVGWQQVWNRWFQFHNDLAGGNPLGRSFADLFVAQFADRIGPVLAAGTRLLTRVDQPHGVLLLVFLLPLLAPRAALSRPLGVITVSLLGSVVALHLVYIGSWLDLEFHLVTSHLRVLLQLVPASLVWCVALLGRLSRPTTTP